MLRRIAEVLAVAAVLSATALPQAPADAAPASHSAPAVERLVTADLPAVTDADFQEVVIKSKKPVAVLFWAAWCGPCRLQRPDVERLAQEHPEILAVRLNVDENPVTPTRYGIESIPAIVVFKKGKVAKTIVGYRQKAGLERELAPFLKKQK